VDPGKLRHKIIIKVQPPGQDSYGEKVSDTSLWTNFVTIRAAIIPISGREFFTAQQVNSTVTTRIEIRYKSGITAGMRVVCGTKVYDIKAPLDLEEKHKEIHLMCEEMG